MISDEEFRILFEEYKDIVYNFSSYYLGDREEAKDITQEAFVRLHTHLSSSKVKNIKHFLLRITRNLCIDHFRKNRRNRVIELEEDKLDHLYRLSKEKEDKLEIELTFKELIKKLPENYRAIISLRYIEQLSYGEISEVMKIPQGTVKTYLYRAKEVLRKQVNGL